MVTKDEMPHVLSTSLCEQLKIDACHFPAIPPELALIQLRLSKGSTSSQIRSAQKRAKSKM